MLVNLSIDVRKIAKINITLPVKTHAMTVTHIVYINNTYTPLETNINKLFKMFRNSARKFLKIKHN